MKNLLMIGAVCAALMVAPLSFAQSKETSKPACCGTCPGKAKDKKEVCNMPKSKTSSKSKTASKKTPAKKKTTKVKA